MKTNTEITTSIQATKFVDTTEVFTDFTKILNRYKQRIAYFRL
ncbi:hypothetical protein [Capnocytophaga cynodegmi]